MDHRFGSRFQLALLADLWRRQNYLGHFQIRDIGHGGLFVCNCSGEVSIGDIVEVRVQRDRVDPEPSDRMVAMAVHACSDGLGFMWADRNALFHRHLDQWRQPSNGETKSANILIR